MGAQLLKDWLLWAWLGAGWDPDEVGVTGPGLPRVLTRVDQTKASWVSSRALSQRTRSSLTLSQASLPSQCVQGSSYLGGLGTGASSGCPQPGR